MNQAMWKQRASAFIALLMVVVTACAPTASTGASSSSAASSTATPAPIRLGVIMDSSGAASYYSKESVKAIQLAADEINAKGGVNGRKIELAIEDDSNKPPDSADRFRKLAADKSVLAVLTVSGSAGALQTQPLAEEEKVPEIAPTNVNDGLTKKYLQYFFRMSPSDSESVAALIEVLAKYKKVAIIGDNTQTGLSTLNSYKTALAAKNVQVVAVEQLDTGTTDASPQVLRMRNAQAEAVLLTAQGAPELALPAKTIQQLGWKVDVFGTSTIGVPAFVELAGAGAEGVKFTDIIDDDKASFQTLVKNWEAKYPGNAISTNPVLSYDAVYMIAEAIKKDGATREGIRSGLEKLGNYVGVSGKTGTFIKLEAGNHQGMFRDSVTLRQYKGGKQVKVTN